MSLKYGAGVVFEENEWAGGHITEADFITLKGYNCGIVRLHAIRLAQIMPTDGVIDTTFFVNYIDKFVALAKKYGMNITIDIGDWNTGSAFGGNGFPTWMTTGFTNRGDFQNAFWDLDNPACSHQRQMFLNVWHFIADRYKAETHVGFSIYNEPLNGAGSRFGTNIHGMSDAAFSDHIGTQYSLFMEQISDTIRATGATIQPIIVNSPFTFYLTDQKKINRADIYWDVHLYYDVNTNYAAWTKMFDDRQNYFASLGMPMIMGEWGIYDWAFFNTIDYKAVLSQLLAYIESKGLVFVEWLGYGAFRTNLTAQQKIDVLSIVCLPATVPITVVDTYVLTVETATGGVTTPTGASTQPKDTKITITAKAATANGYAFAGWEINGQLQSIITDNPLVFNITADTTVKPLFTAPPLLFSLVVLASVNGTPSLAPGTYQASSGTYTISAVADSGYAFDHWIVDGATVTTPSISVDMTANHTVQAFFVASVVPPPPPKSLAARTIGPFGLPSAALRLLWIARERVIRPEVHRKLHPLV